MCVLCAAESCHRDMSMTSLAHLFSLQTARRSGRERAQLAAARRPGHEGTQLAAARRPGHEGAQLAAARRPEHMPGPNPRARPIASPALTTRLVALKASAELRKQVTKGTSESTLHVSCTYVPCLRTYHVSCIEQVKYYFDNPQVMTHVVLYAVLCCVATLALNRGLLGLVVLAADCDPIEIVMHVAHIAGDRHVPYVFINSKTGTASHITCYSCSLVNPESLCPLTTYTCSIHSNSSPFTMRDPICSLQPSDARVALGAEAAVRPLAS